MKPGKEALQSDVMKLSERLFDSEQDRTKLRSELEEALKEIYRISDLLTERSIELGGLRKIVTNLSEQLAARDEEITRLRRVIEDQMTDLSKLRETTGKARNLDGWTVRQVGGYFRLYKSIGGKVHSIHVGRELNTEKAREKIREKMNKLR